MEYLLSIDVAKATPDVALEPSAEAGQVRQLTACMRKLLTILNAMLRHHTPWRLAMTRHTRWLLIPSNFGNASTARSILQRSFGSNLKWRL